MNARHPVSVPLPKRTRVLKKAQAKSGCSTCKDRRVKCDETRPVCQRCIRANITCRGYELQDAVTTIIKKSTRDRETVCTGVAQELTVTDPGQPLTRDYTKRICNALCSSTTALPGETALKEVVNAIPTFLPSSISALSLLEMLIHSNVALEPDARGDNDIYSLALSQFREEIDSKQESMLLLITCILLQATELLQRHRQNGLKHGIAAFKLIQRSPTLNGSVLVLLQAIDLQCMLFSEGVRLPILELDSRVDSSLEHRGIAILHVCHSFIAQAHSHAILGNTFPATTKLSAHVDCLIDYRRELRSKIIKHRYLKAASIWLVLENLNIMTTMQLQLLDSVRETDWDAHLPLFTAITDNAAVLLPNTTQNSSDFAFVTGLIPPLCLVAQKCRYPAWRRKAINLLQRSGCEGPFIGIQLAAMAERCMVIEEGPNSFTAPDLIGMSQAPINLRRSPALPDESIRIAKCALLEDNGSSDSAILPQIRVGRTKVRFLRRRQACSVILASMVTSAHHRPSTISEEQEKRIRDENWEYWTETLQYGAQLNSMRLTG